MNYIPYTYYIIHRPTGLRYYGVKVAKHKRNIANPATFWVTYFTSSKKVHELIKEYGKDSFDVEVRRTFHTANEALSWEANVLRKLDVMNRSDWINGNIKGVFNINAPKTQEHKQKISNALKGVKKPSSVIEKVRLANVGKKMSDHVKDKMSQTRKGLIWISNVAEKKTKHIDPSKVEPFLEAGWVMGRIFFKHITCHTDESKLKMSKSKKGSVCVIKDGQVRMINKNLVDQYIINGWRRGRK